MGINFIGVPSASSMSDWHDARANVPRQAQQKQKSDRDKAMETFADAMRDCDKAIETVVDKHQESVAQSMEKIKEYRKKLAREEQREKAAEEQRLFYAEVLAKQVSLRNMLKEQRMEDTERREEFDARG